MWFTSTSTFTSPSCCRWDFELYRFDLVRYMNQLDSKKVLLLETGINNTFYGRPIYGAACGVCSSIHASMTLPLPRLFTL